MKKEITKNITKKMKDKMEATKDGLVEASEDVPQTKGKKVLQSDIVQTKQEKEKTRQKLRQE